MVIQNNVYQLKRIVAKMTNNTPDKITGETTADLLSQIADAYTSGGGSGATVVGAKAYVNPNSMQGGGAIELSDGTSINMDLVFPTDLVITAEAGSEPKKTKFTITPALTAGNKYKIKSNGLPCVYNYDLSEYGEDWDGVSEVTADFDERFYIYECSPDNKCRGFGKVTAVIPE